MFVFGPVTSSKFGFKKGTELRFSLVQCSDVFGFSAGFELLLNSLDVNSGNIHGNFCFNNYSQSLSIGGIIFYLYQKVRLLAP